MAQTESDRAEGEICEIGLPERFDEPCRVRPVWRQFVVLLDHRFDLIDPLEPTTLFEMHSCHTARMRQIVERVPLPDTEIMKNGRNGDLLFPAFIFRSIAQRHAEMVYPAAVVAVRVEIVAEYFSMGFTERFDELWRLMFHESVFINVPTRQYAFQSHAACFCTGWNSWCS